MTNKPFKVGDAVVLTTERFYDSNKRDTIAPLHSVGEIRRFSAVDPSWCVIKFMQLDREVVMPLQNLMHAIDFLENYLDTHGKTIGPNNG